MPDNLLRGVAHLAVFCTSRLVCAFLHELAHWAAAVALGHSTCGVTLSCASTYFTGGAAGSIAVPGISSRHALFVRHAGWLASVCIVLVFLSMPHMPSSILMASVWTALDAISSDALQQELGAAQTAAVFSCGNFGILVLSVIHQSRAYRLLHKMLRVTMVRRLCVSPSVRVSRPCVCGRGLDRPLCASTPAAVFIIPPLVHAPQVRGAQSAGIVTYEQSGGVVRGHRSRVVNGKRTDLAELLLKRLGALGDCLGRVSSPVIDQARIYQGHTRFATSSISNLAGCHPHQWLPRSSQKHWRFVGDAFVGVTANVEGYITHNGDLDLFQIHGVKYPLEELQLLLAHFLGVPPPAEVDSCASPPHP